MKKTLLQVVGTCFVLVAFAFSANAQSMTVTGEPLSPEQMDPDETSAYMNANNKKVDGLNQGQKADDEKFATWKASGFTTTDGSPDPTGMDAEQANLDEQAKIYADEQAGEAGYVAVPGFTWQDQDPEVTAAEYEAALQAFFADEAAQQALEASDPALFEEIMELND